ncbi:hypothetical protein ABK040_003621 [Willaertia magna]
MVHNFPQYYSYCDISLSTICTTDTTIPTTTAEDDNNNTLNNITTLKELLNRKLNEKDRKAFSLNFNKIDEILTIGKDIFDIKVDLNFIYILYQEEQMIEILHLKSKLPFQTISFKENENLNHLKLLFITLDNYNSLDKLLTTNQFYITCEDCNTSERLILLFKKEINEEKKMSFEFNKILYKASDCLMESIIYSNHLYLVDCFNHHIKVLDKESGEILDTFGSEGNEPLQFSEPTGISIDNDGLLYIADLQNYRIQIITPNGIPIQIFNINPDIVVYPSKVLIDKCSGNIFVWGETCFCKMCIFDLERGEMKVFDPEEYFGNMMACIAGVDIDCEGNLFLAERGKGIINTFK